MYKFWAKFTVKPVLIGIHNAAIFVINCMADTKQGIIQPNKEWNKTNKVPI